MEYSVFSNCKLHRASNKTLQILYLTIFNNLKILKLLKIKNVKRSEIQIFKIKAYTIKRILLNLKNVK